MVKKLIITDCNNDKSIENKKILLATTANANKVSVNKYAYERLIAIFFLNGLENKLRNNLDTSNTIKPSTIKVDITEGK